MPVTPNHLTTLRLVTGFGSAAAFATGLPDWQFIGAAVLVLSLFLDRADGALARVSGKMSRGGHLYDLVADGASNAAVFAGIVVATAELMVMRLDSAGVHSSAELGGRWGIDPDDGMFVVPIAMFFWWAKPLLVLAARGGSVAVIVFVILWLRRRTSAANG